MAEDSVYIFWNIWNFILLLTEDDSVLKVALKITFQGLAACKPAAYKKIILLLPYFKVDFYVRKFV